MGSSVLYKWARVYSEHRAELVCLVSPLLPSLVADSKLVSGRVNCTTYWAGFSIYFRDVQVYNIFVSNSDMLMILIYSERFLFYWTVCRIVSDM